MKPLACLVAVCVAGMIAGSMSAAQEPAAWPPRSGLDAPAAPSTSPRRYLLTFREVEVAEVADAVLGDALNLPYRVSPAVSGPISFTVDERLTPPQLLARFEATLRARGISIQATGSQLVLAPMPAAAPAASRQDAPDAPPAGRRGAPWWNIAALLVACAVAGALSAAWAAARGRRAPRHADREAVVAFLVESGLVDLRQVARARLVAAREGAPVERVLARDAGVGDDALADAYSAVTGAPVWRPSEHPPLDPQPDLADGAVDSHMLALADDGAQLTVATDDPLSDGATARLAFASGRAVVLQVAKASDLAMAKQSLAYSR